MSQKSSKNDDHTAGDNISVGNITNSNGVAIGRNIEVTVRVEAIKSGDESAKAELGSLIQELNDALQQVPKAKSDEAQAVAETAQTLMNKAADEKPNKSMIQISGDALKQAAQNIADVAPTVLQIASQIVTTIAMITNR
jgi:hypothetical protein